MFKKIYLFELNSWFNKPAFYIYSVLCLGLAMLLMAAVGGAFDGATSTVSSLNYINSPNGLLQIIFELAIYLFLLFPNIVGASIHKDYKHNVHKVMYSFPFDKSAYFWGKYLSSLTICFILTLFLAVGVYAGTMMSGINKDLIGPHSLKPYIDIFLFYIIPGIFLFGSIVFAVVTFSRSVVAGFVVMIIIFIFQGVLGSALSNNDWEMMASLIDPFGITANSQLTKYWTISEQNNLPIPMTGYVLWNRIIWIITAMLILAWTYISFDFKVEPKGWNIFKRKAKEVASVAHQKVTAKKVKVPSVSRSYGLMQNLKSAWQLSKIDLRYILTGGPFVVITVLGLVIILLIFVVSGMMFETPTLPTTKEMINKAGNTFYIFILLLTFVYTGMTINRKRNDNIYQLEDVTPNKDWSFILSKFMTITLMQAVLFLVPIVAGVAYQIYSGYYDFELGLYIKDLYGIRILGIIPLTLLAILIYTLIPNFYVGLVIALGITIGLGFVDRIGIEQDIYKYNHGQGVQYSDIDGYGWFLNAFYFYRAYWVLGGLFLTSLAWFIWSRGSDTSLLSRLKNVGNKFSIKSSVAILGVLAAFLGMGYCIYHHNNVMDTYVSSKQDEANVADYEKLYKHFEKTPQPRITDVNLDVEIYPKEGNLEVDGLYWVKNKESVPIDTMIFVYRSMAPSIDFDRKASLIKHDSVLKVMLYSLDIPLLPSDTMEVTFNIKNKKNNIFRKYAPVRENGTFFDNSYFPIIGYQAIGELSERKARQKYGLEDKERMAPATDSLARRNTYISNCADWIDFEIKIGTSNDQIAIAPGNLIKEWDEGDRKYFHYKMKRQMLNFYNVCSARYEIKKDKWSDPLSDKEVDLSIFYHKGHEYNLDRMMAGLKDGLDYFTSEFSQYQHDQMRILEVPRVGFAQSFANTVPFSENVGFVMQADDSKDGGVDYTYAITAHELAHQWWAHQVIGANVQGATMLSESLSEYSSLKVLEKKYGKAKMRKFLKDALDKYLMQRNMESKKELPLAYNENQPYIHYNKGSMIFYAISDYIGEDVLNNVLSEYIDSVAHQEAPYTTALDLVERIKVATPDSLQYIIEDMFETITLYDNRITASSYVDNGDGSYTVDITAEVTKYRTDERGRQSFVNQDSVSISHTPEGSKNAIESYPLSDYVDVGIYGNMKDEDGDDEEIELYLKKHKITEIENKYTITVNEEPTEVGIDPYNKLIDRNSEDNRRKVEKTKKE